ncbi:MAG: hypothetical protein ACKVZH_25030 [Blastocatellia bacterium]
MTFLLLAVMVGGAFIWWGKQAVERAIERAEGNWSELVVVNAPPIPGVPLPPEISVPEASAVSLDSLKYPGSTVIESERPILYRYVFNERAWLDLLPDGRFDASEEGRKYLCYTEQGSLHSYSADSMEKDFFDPAAVRVILEQFSAN